MKFESADKTLAVEIVEHLGVTIRVLGGHAFYFLGQLRAVGDGLKLELAEGHTPGLPEHCPGCAEFVIADGVTDAGRRPSSKSDSEPEAPYPLDLGDA